MRAASEVRTNSSDAMRMQHETTARVRESMRKLRIPGVSPFRLWNLRSVNVQSSRDPPQHILSHRDAAEDLKRSLPIWPARSTE
jgi:hypothetical protein